MGMPGMGELMEGAMQQAAQRSRQFMRQLSGYVVEFRTESAQNAGQVA